MPGVVVTPALTQTDLAAALAGKADASAVPIPATTMPPGVSDTGAVGTQTTVFALANHTHAAKARKGIAAVNTATFTWTYPTAFSAGVTPIVNGIAQCAVGTTDLFNVQIDGVPTNTSCVFRITRYQQSVASLLGLTVLSLNATPGSINLHMIAFEP